MRLCTKCNRPSGGYRYCTDCVEQAIGLAAQDVGRDMDRRGELDEARAKLVEIVSRDSPPVVIGQGSYRRAYTAGGEIRAAALWVWAVAVVAIVAVAVAMLGGGE